MHTAMHMIKSPNNSVRHLPLAQLEGLAAQRGVAQNFRKFCANVCRNYWTEKIEQK
jgi:hypothetical protein